MLTLVFSFLLAMVLAVLAALIKFNKQYNLIAGYTVEAVEKDEKLKQNAHRIADSLFVMAALMIVFPILNLFVDWFQILHPDLDGMMVIFSAILGSLLYYFVSRQLKK